MGKVVYEDSANNLKCTLSFGLKGKPKDYLEGHISQSGVIKSCLKGTYMGWLAFDGQRYWDLRETIRQPMHQLDRAPSDC